MKIIKRIKIWRLFRKIKKRDFQQLPGVYQTLRTIPESPTVDIFESWGLEKETLDPELKKWLEDAEKFLRGAEEN